MLEVNFADVVNILDLCIPYLIAVGVVILVGIIVCIACRKLPIYKKFMIRRQSLMAMLLAVVIGGNLTCFGPMSTLLTLSTGEGTITEETVQESEELVEEIAAEGILLMTI